MAKTPKAAAAKSPAPAPEESQARMTFGEHLDELRKRIMRALLGGLIGVGLCVYFMFDIYGAVVHPYIVAARAHNANETLSTLRPQEAFFTFLTLAVKAGLILTSPWIIYQLWQFVSAGLYKKERRIVYRYIGPSAFLFLLGVAFFYFIVLPMTLNFFFTFSEQSGRNIFNIPTHIATAPTPATATGPEQTALQNLPALAQDPPAPADGQAILYFHTGEHRVKIRLPDKILVLMVSDQDSLIINTWRADDYLNFVAFTALIFGLAFELPMVMLVLAQIDIVRAKSYRGMRKYAYFGIMIAAVIVAPSGDIMTLAFLFVPLLLLYEVGIIAAAIATRNRPNDD